MQVFFCVVWEKAPTRPINRRRCLNPEFAVPGYSNSEAFRTNWPIRNTACKRVPPPKSNTNPWRVWVLLQTPVPTKLKRLHRTFQISPLKLQVSQVSAVAMFGERGYSFSFNNSLAELKRSFQEYAAQNKLGTHSMVQLQTFQIGFQCRLYFTFQKIELSCLLRIN